MNIDSTAFICPDAEMAAHVLVGPYAVIGSRAISSEEGSRKRRKDAKEGSRRDKRQEEQSTDLWLI